MVFILGISKRHNILLKGEKNNIPIYQINKNKKIRAEQQKMKSRWGTTDGINGANFTEQDPRIWDLQLLVTPFVHVNVPECCENVC